MRSGSTLCCALLAAGLAMSTGCSLLLRSEASQCSKDSDCASQGSAFEGFTCSSGTCVAPDAGMRNDSDQDAAPQGCSSNADCTAESSQYVEVVCETETKSCLQLTTEACPFVVGDWRTENPLVLGAFALISTLAPKEHASTLNYTLAIEELATAGGIPVGAGTKLRSPVVVVCNAKAVDAGLEHLVDTLHVPGLVTTFDSKTLRTEFKERLQESKTFTISPYGADSTLTSQNDGLLWHMLGEPSDLVPTYEALFGLLEPYVQTKIGAGPTALRVATISGDTTVETDLAESVTATLSWNGKSLKENTDDKNYLNIALPSTLSGKKLDDIDVEPAVQALLAFKPHIIISFSSEEFSKLVQVLEIVWPASSGPRPFYVLSPYNTSDKALFPLAAGSDDDAESFRSRIAGINVASTSEARVLDAYERRFIGRFPTAQSALGQENYYDAMYFLVYAAVGAGRVSGLSGENLREGMQRLFSGTSIDMGPKDLGNAFGALGTPKGSISLFGTLGAPTFNLGTGARRGAGSVYCIALEGQKNPVYKFDTLRVVAAKSGDEGAPTLEGTFPCYEGLVP